jgi:hypothetical protein
MWLSNHIRDDVADACEVFYVTREIAAFWNDNRAKGDPLVFTGWYWAKGAREGGPFKSKSSCYRDAWFRVVREEAPPALHADAARIERRNSRRENRARRETMDATP